jgi:hypothetical protein
MRGKDATYVADPGGRVDPERINLGRLGQPAQGAALNAIQIAEIYARSTEIKATALRKAYGNEDESILFALSRKP